MNEQLRSNINVLLDDRVKKRENHVSVDKQNIISAGVSRTEPTSSQTQWAVYET